MFQLTPYLVAFTAIALMMAFWVAVQFGWRKIFPEQRGDEDALACRGGCLSCKGDCSLPDDSLVIERSPESSDGTGGSTGVTPPVIKRM